MTELSTCLWFAKEAEEAARHYVRAVPNSAIGEVMARPPEVPGAEGSVLMVTFTLAGAPILAFNGDPPPGFTNGMSLVVSCADQAELDRVWDGLLEGGGQPVACGWLKDRFGVAWQVVPEVLPRLMKAGDTAQRGRVMAALMQMVKLDAAALEAAFRTS